MRKIYLDALPERLQEEILQDRAEVRDETIMGLTPARWAQVTLLFHGEPGADVLYCFSQGLSVIVAAAYLGISERTAKNVGHRYLNKLQAMKEGVAGAGAQEQIFAPPDHDDDFRFAPDRRIPTRRGRPRKTAVETPQQLEMCY